VLQMRYPATTSYRQYVPPASVSATCWRCTGPAPRLSTQRPSAATPVQQLTTCLTQSPNGITSRATGSRWVLPPAPGKYHVPR
jgi:hypothetical protein